MAGQRSEASVEIAASPERVFEWLVDREKMAVWQQSPVEWLPDDRGELRAGYEGIEEVAIPTAGRAQPAGSEVEVTIYEPPRRFEFISRNQAFEANAGYTLEAVGAGTRVHTFADTRYLGSTDQLAEMPGVGERLRTMQQQGHEQSLARLKQLVEGDGGGGD